MPFDYLIVNVIFAALGALILYIFIIKNFNIIFNVKKLIVFCFIFGLLNGFISNLIPVSNTVTLILKTIMIIIVSVLIVRSILPLSIVNSIVSFCLFAIGLFLGSEIGPVIANVFGANLTPLTIMQSIGLYIISNLSSTLICAAFLMIIYQVRNAFTKVKNNRILAIDLIITFFIVVITCGIQLIYKQFDFLPWILIILISVIYISTDIWKSIRFYKQERAKVEFEQQKFYNAQLEGLLTQMRRFKHDWANNLNVIQLMIKTGKTDQAKAYLDELVGDNTKIFNTAVFNIKNVGLFSIVSSKLSLAAEKGINFDLHVIGEVRDISNVKITELCEVMGIILDNAIEAAELSEYKKVDLNLSTLETGIEIQITNSCDHKPDVEKIFKEGYSTKGTGRGNGLFIVKNIIDKYENILLDINYNLNEKEFSQSIVIA